MYVTGTVEDGKKKKKKRYRHGLFSRLFFTNPGQNQRKVSGTGRGSWYCEAQAESFREVRL